VPVPLVVLIQDHFTILLSHTRKIDCKGRYEFVFHVIGVLLSFRQHRHKQEG